MRTKLKDVTIEQLYDDGVYAKIFKAWKENALPSGFASSGMSFGIDEYGNEIMINNKEEIAVLDSDGTIKKKFNDVHLDIIPEERELILRRINKIKMPSLSWA